MGQPVDLVKDAVDVVAATPALEPPILKSDTQSAPVHAPSLWGLLWAWRWETLSSVVSVASMALVLSILANINDMALSDWPLPIQPNSLIAICTTLGKSAMMVLVASCISQLKWKYFAHRPRPLHHLQTIDDASRGPWGSLVVLFSGPTRSWVISGFAFAAIVSLGIEPSAQQILGVGVKEVELTNLGTEVGMARGYHSVDTGRQTTPRTVMSAMLGSEPPANFYCPPLASRCVWQDFTILSMCSDMQTITEDKVTSNCTRLPDNTFDPRLLSVDCTITFPGDHKFRSPNPLSVSMSKKVLGDSWIYNKLDSRKILTSTQYGGWVDFAAVNASQATFTASTNILSGVTVYIGKMSWCSRIIRNFTVNAGGKPTATTSDEPLTLVNRTYVGEGTRRILDKSIYHAPSTDDDFLIYVGSDVGIWMYLTSILLVDNKSGQSDPPGRSLVSENAILELFLFDDLSDAIAKITRSITAQINLIGGDNANVTRLTGMAYANVPRYTVRWVWAILPLVETVLVTALMALTMFREREEPLWRTSALAMLFHRLEGHELEDAASACRTDTCLERVASGFQARLAPDKADHLAFLVERKKRET
ncbi:hypothetical protein B0T25DRAFT_520344 [Lasiosphaeria hispida]|uniref:Uncharacterized protein n=1 Tax=Lasiosphaeria hispida TaxID=260671 RepID=A0AAJ0MA08_9PEZI|nr:hypothetical protein B0T25DRAFT_520344 [Lasiosphaeria hispida]